MRGRAHYALNAFAQGLIAPTRFSSSLSHVRDGTARMVDTAAKAVSQRIAVAEALVVLPAETMEAVHREHGDSIATSKVRKAWPAGFAALHVEHQEWLPAAQSAVQHQAHV